ncbi:MAG: transposase [Rhodospirillales bacterium]|nr:transposase [Rhodospirillales bacterium]
MARRRAPVEADFSASKWLYGQRRARSCSLERNTARLYAVAIAYNMRCASLLAGA